MKSFRFITSIFVISLFSLVFSEKLEIVNDDEILNLIRTEKYVVVLFSEYFLTTICFGSNC